MEKILKCLRCSEYYNLASDVRKFANCNRVLCYLCGYRVKQNNDKYLREGENFRRPGSMKSTTGYTVENIYELLPELLSTDL